MVKSSMKSQSKNFHQGKLLIYAIGNEGRQDDGLAHEFVKKIPSSEHYDIHQNYQLNVEDAELISQYRQVLFVDAAKNQDEPYRILHPQAKPETGFTTHGLSIEGIMAMTQNLFGELPEISLLAIQGQEFNLTMGLTNKAQVNLSQALEWFEQNF